MFFPRRLGTLLALPAVRITLRCWRSGGVDVALLELLPPLSSNTGKPFASQQLPATSSETAAFPAAGLGRQMTG